MTKTVTYISNNGPDIPQGDLLLTNLRHPVFGKRWQDRMPAGTLIRQGDGMIEVPVTDKAEMGDDASLSADRLRELLTYSPETGAFTWKAFMGGRASAGSTAGAVNSAGYVCIKVDRKKYQASRLAWLYVHGVWPFAYVDHIDGDRTNNRLSNLREATPTENKHNSRAGINSVSGVKGVFWNAKRNKWQARICLADGKRQHLGYFHDLAEAEAAYAAKAAEVHGAFVAKPAETGVIRLLAGEATGHHHEILFGSRHLARFRDDGLAHDIAVAAPVAVGSARLVSDDALLTDLIRSGHWHERYRGLHIGFLFVENGPVELIHPEHDAWRLPPGLYSVGRQVESAGAEERQVVD